jgi:hypothetical protein
MTRSDVISIIATMLELSPDHTLANIHNAILPADKANAAIVFVNGEYQLFDLLYEATLQTPDTSYQLFDLIHKATLQTPDTSRSTKDVVSPDDDDDEDDDDAPKLSFTIVHTRTTTVEGRDTDDAIDFYQQDPHCDGSSVYTIQSDPPTPGVDPVEF